MNPIAEALDNPQALPTMAEPGDVAQDREAKERPPFPPRCPIKPLGISSDMSGMQKCYYLDWNGQLVGLEANNRHGKLGLIALFGPSSDWLEANFPQWSAPRTKTDRKTGVETIIKPSEIVGFDQAEAARALIEECARRGIFNPAGRMRGRGAQRGRDGSGVVLHCGDKLMVAKLDAERRIKGWRWIDPGLHDTDIYAAGEAIPRPATEPADCGPAETLLSLLQTWNWERPLLDPRFLLGAVGLSFVGGWLRWRSNVWITGQRGAGKSTLDGESGIIPAMFGRGVFKTSDTSAAAIRQTLRNSTIPVMVDEIEAGADNRRVLEVVALARLASSGATASRGGQDHQAHEFTLKSQFWFSSILIPPLEPADMSRLCLLNLKKFPAGAQEPDFAKYDLPKLGRLIFRRMVDTLWRFEATKAKFHKALSATGHDSRACDQFGTILAAADVLLWDHESDDGLPPDEEVNRWALACHPRALREVADAVSEQDACLADLTSYQVQASGGQEREALSYWIGEAVAIADGGEASENKPAKRLEQMGLKIVNAKWTAAEAGKPGRWGAANYAKGKMGYLAVAHSHKALGAVYANSKWQGGVWRQSLERAEGAIRGVTVSMARQKVRATLVPLCHVLDESELDQASTRAALAALVAAQEEGPEA